MGKSISIVGMGGSAIQGFGSTDEVWGINHAYVYGKCDRLFMMDNFSEIVRDSKYYDIDWYDGIKDSKLFTKYPLEIGLKDGQYGFSHKVGGIAETGGKLIKTSTQFDMEATLPYMGTMDMQCTLSYAIAQAIIENVSMIQLWGIEIWEFGATGAYGYQMANVNDWLRVAMANGIKVTVPFQIIPKIMSSKRIER